MLEYSEIVVGRRFRYHRGPCEAIEAVVVSAPHKPDHVNYMDHYVTLVFEDGSRDGVAYFDLRDEKYWETVDLVSLEKVAEVVAFGEHYRANRDEATARLRMYREAAQERVRTAFPHLQPVSTDDVANPCPNIRRHLKKLFPALSFRVRKPSRGAVEVSIDGGPTFIGAVRHALAGFESGFNNQFDSFTRVRGEFRELMGETRYLYVDKLRKPAAPSR